MPRWARAVAVVAVIVVALWAWARWWPSDEQQIRRRLQAFTADFNESTTEGLGSVTRAARLASYFTDDVVVELGGGAPPIRGRETLIGMATRLQPRTATFTLRLVDVTVAVGADRSAEVSLTAAFRRRSFATGEESIDARELSLTLTRADGEWRVSHVRTVEAFR